MYSVNIEPHTAGAAPARCIEFAFDVDEHYVAECRERALVLAAEPLRYQALPHMMSAQWDCLELIMESLARDYPAHFSLDQAGQSLALDQPALGASTSASPSASRRRLPRQPLDYITRQAQGDFVVMDQREGDLWTEAGMVTTQADWSLDFDMGMTFKEWHGPVPLAHELRRVRPRAQIPAESAPGPAGAAAQLDHDRQSAPRHLAGELSEVGPGPRDRDARRTRAISCICASSCRGCGGCRAATASCSASVAISSACASWRRFPSGRGASTACSRDLHPALVDYKGLTPLPGHGGRVAGAFR